MTIRSGRKRQALKEPVAIESSAGVEGLWCGFGGIKSIPGKKKRSRDVLFDSLSRNDHLILPFILSTALNTVRYGVSYSWRTTTEISPSHHKFVQDTMLCRIIIDTNRLDIKLEPSTSNYDISLKILVDEQEPVRLATIQRGLPLSWEMALSWFDLFLCQGDVGPSSRVEIRVFEKHFMSNKRVGTLGYTVSTAADKSETQIDFDTRRFTATLSFPTPEAVDQAAAAALTKAQEKEKKTRILERLGPTREALKAILDFGQALSELHPAAKAAFSVYTRKARAVRRQR
ncbi:hypothetical protein BDV93DRAFT_509956 [Ceratobasidium sp. AG-I]|nr:hypothetical protein BDV93DRAFT_509956 [Ceratobasidium sp. AG-I]